MEGKNFSDLHSKFNTLPLRPFISIGLYDNVRVRMSDYIYVQLGPDSFLVGEPPFCFSANPSATEPSFYSNHFDLSVATPWIIPHHTSLHSKKSFTELFSASLPDEDIHWHPVSTAGFEEAFDAAKSLIKNEQIEKAVPLLFEPGTIPHTWAGKELSILTTKLLRSHHTNLHLYGFSQNGCGICGATPEVLFSVNGTELKTAALAGTKDALLGRSALSNSKDSREHAIVVEDIDHQLKQFGTVQIAETIPYPIGPILHLRTEISLAAAHPLSFESAIHALHPTAALGIYPRNEAGQRYLVDLGVATDRKSFGAPFGIQFPDGSGVCFVAIRCLEWSGKTARIGSGCGVIAESVLEDELQELSLKRASIKGRLAV